MRTRVQFATADDKAAFIAHAAERDSWDPIVREAARPFTLTQAGREVSLRALHRFVRDQIHYQRDFGGQDGGPGEELADAATVLLRRFDDCDGKARTMAAMLHAVARERPCWGLEVRIVTTFYGADFKHVRAAVRWPGSGGWVTSDPTIAGAELGDRPLGGRYV